MHNELFFPLLVRQPEESYFSSKNTFYATYNSESNYINVAKDCLHRCVYCDVKEKECGGEKFSLDHFRPQAVFANKFNGLLIKHPHNLYLSCQKCNVLKSHDWKGCREDIKGPSYISSKGYIDRFSHKFSDYMEVQPDGVIKCINPSGPGEYMIRRLHLNRPNRIYLRKRRYVSLLAKNVEQLLSTLNDIILDKYNKKLITPEESMLLIEKSFALSKQFKNIDKDW